MRYDGPVRRPIALALLLFFAACAPSRAALRPGDAARLGERFDLRARDVEGRPRTVAGYTTGRVALIDVWATWCKPCRQSLPAWEELRRRFDGRLAVVAISIDEDSRQLPKFLAGLDLGYPVLWDRGGGEALARLALEKVPTLLVLDRAGRVRHVHEGWFGASTVEAIEAEVAALLAEDAARPAP